METNHIPSMEIRQITKSYRHGKWQGLHDLSLEAQDGECIGILGTNGCGKSTLLSILAGSRKADSGQLLYHGQPLTDSRQFAQICGYVPQENPLIEELDAYDNLRLWYCDSTLDLAEELESGFLSMLDIPSFLHVKVHRMSGGMKKRLSIGCAMANDPPVLLLDEPGAALDLLCKEQITRYLMDCKKRGKIIWIATHEPSEIAICDSLYLLQNGHLNPIEYHGDIRQITDALKQK
ncbi:MAG: ATP-binding cassette domain-containing protein [Eubacteriales bacterium]|nr:ATP-binding cassette domain-containing protein [Eubacteriales bacterium]